MSDTPETDAAIKDQSKWMRPFVSTTFDGITYDSPVASFCRKLERERDEAREALKHIEEYGTEEINAAVELRQKLATALVERDEAREKYTTLLTDNMLDVHKLYKAIELIKSLINQIERPAYGVDEAVEKMFLMEDAKKFANEMQ
jgi:hypothetical protein